MTSRRCCWTRPAPSRTATGWRRRSSPSTAPTNRRWPRWRSCPACPTRRPRGAPLSPSPSSGTSSSPPTPHTRSSSRSRRTRAMSGIDWDGRVIRKGAVDSVRGRRRSDRGGHVPADLDGVVDSIARTGGTPLAVAEGNRVLGVIHLKDTVKTGIADRFDQMRAMGIRTVMITGDNPVTAAAIAAEAGVDDYLAQATPRTRSPYPRRASRRRTRRHDRRRHERRSRPGPGRCRCRHEHRYPGRQGSREHGRPRLGPHQGPRDRRDRQAAPHHPGRADHVLDRQRRGQVLRHHPGDVLGCRCPRSTRST